MNKRNLLIASIMAAVLVLLGAVPEEGYAATGMKVTQGSGKSTETADGSPAVQMLEDIETAAKTEGSSYDIHYYTDGGALSGDYVKSYQYNVGAALPALSTIDFGPPFGPTICPIPPDCPAKNTVMTNDSLKYKVTKSSPKNGTVSVIGVKSKKIAKATIPASVMFYGYIFKVTEIGPKAFKGCKKLKSVTVGKNIKKIGSKAFYQDKKLKKITVKSKKLKTVGKNALKDIGKKAVIKVPKAKKKAYKKLMNRKTGFGKATKLK